MREGRVGGRRELVLGRSLSKFMRTLGVYSSSGGTQTRLRNQMRRLFNAHVQLIYEDELGEASVSSSVADRTELALPFLSWVASQNRVFGVVGEETGLHPGSKDHQSGSWPAGRCAPTLSVMV